MSHDTISRYRVFCPRCGDEFVKSGETKVTIRKVIDRPCRECKKDGVDALELTP